jgi:cytochrome c biogenesis protein CcmG/thiol:disulfide interchange protein DsbE
LTRDGTPLLACLLGLVLVCGPAVRAADVRPPLELSLPSLRPGAPIRLAQYRGQVVYLDVWASWCAPCLRSMPELDTLRERFRGQPFEVVAVNVDSDTAVARAFLERVRIHYPVAFDREGSRLREQLDELDVAGLPIGFLLDGRGAVRLVHRGYSPGQVDFLSEHIDTLLAELRIE